jgi:hypothetical protein
LFTPLPAYLVGLAWTRVWTTTTGCRSSDAKGWTVFGRDQRILDRPIEVEAYLAARVHMFLLPGQARRDEIVHLLEVTLRDVCTVAVARAPNVYWLTPHGVVDYERRRAERERRRQQRG